MVDNSGALGRGVHRRPSVTGRATVASMTNSGGWTTHSTTVEYQNAWISVREDTVTRPDGEAGIYGVVTMHNPAVFVVAITDDDEVLMVSLYRYATRATSLEVPAGGCDGDDPLAAAQRELLEETGYVAREWREIGRMNALNGVCDAPEFVYLAQGLSRKDAERPTDTASGVDVRAEQRAEGIDAVRLVPWDDALSLVRDGTIRDGETVAALMFAALALGAL